MSQDAELEPGAVGAVVIGWNRVEGKLGFEFGDVFSWAPRPAAKYHKARGVRERLVATAEYSK